MAARFSAPVQTGPGAHPASCTMGTGSFLGVKSGRGVTLTLHPLLVPWSRKGRAIPLLRPWAVRPVQSLSACTRVHFTFTVLSVSDAVMCVTVTTHNIQITHYLHICSCVLFLIMWDKSELHNYCRFCRMNTSVSVSSVSQTQIFPDEFAAHLDSYSMCTKVLCQR